jgi:Na+/H+-dicarboxylate symporter
MRRGLGEGGRLRWKVVSIILLTVFCGLTCVFAAEKGPTIVIKKDEHRIAGVGTNGITRWTSSVARDEEVVSAVNQSGNTAMVSVMNKKTGKTRILNYDAEKGILRFSQSVN